MKYSLLTRKECGHIVFLTLKLLFMCRKTKVETAFDFAGFDKSFGHLKKNNIKG